MNTVLIYSPSVVGHPAIYCRVIADSLADENCNIVIAIGLNEVGSISESKDLQSLSIRADIKLIDCKEYSAAGNPSLSAEELLNLQETFKINTTLFIEADKYKEQFLRIFQGLAPRLRGRNIGIFAATSNWHPGEDTYTGEKIRLKAKTVRTTLGNIKRAIFNRRESAKFFYEKIIISGRVLDEIWVKDERLEKWYGPPVYWMPEISRPDTKDESATDIEELARHRSGLREFFEKNNGREPLLYFGDAAYYKGYDIFLEFIANNPDTCAIHPGRSYDSNQKQYFSVDVEFLRSSLLAQGRLYETNGYIHTQSLKELFFNSIRVYITTHRLALSSSTMIQAIELGKPVLVPDRGLIGFRVSKNGLGGVYRYGDLNDLSAQAQALWNSDLTRFVAPLEDFWQRFSAQSLRTFFVARLLSK